MNQSYRIIQVVFVDDGITDNSIEIFNSKLAIFTEKEITYDSYFFENNGGRIRALNKAIEMNEGQFSSILDSDDALYHNFIEISKCELERERERDATIGFVYTNLDIIDKQDKTISYGISEEFDADKALLYSFIPECSLTYTHILKSCLPFDEKVKVNTKHHKWQKIITAGWNGKLIPLILYKYRMHETICLVLTIESLPTLQEL
jgi:glycosyltransferase involved in cell wall biosynthesis